MGTILNFIIKATAIRAAEKAVKNVCVTQEKIAKNNKKSNVNMGLYVIVPRDIGDYRGKNYSDAEMELRAYGFENISLVSNNDSINKKTTKYGDVINIIINGETYFEKGDKFLSDSKVVIIYKGSKQTYRCPNCNLLIKDEK